MESDTFNGKFRALMCPRDTLMLPVIFIKLALYGAE